MKRILALILTLLSVLVFVSCSSGGSGGGGGSQDPIGVDDIVENLEKSGFTVNEQTSSANETLDQLNEMLEKQGIDALSGKIKNAYAGVNKKTYETVTVIELESSSDAKKIVELYSSMGMECERDGKTVVIASSKDVIDSALGKDNNDKDETSNKYGDDETSTDKTDDTSTSVSPIISFNTVKNNLINIGYVSDAVDEDTLIKLYQNLLEQTAGISSDISRVTSLIASNTHDSNVIIIFEFETLSDAKNVYNYFSNDSESESTYVHRSSKVVILSSNECGLGFATGTEQPEGATVFLDPNGGLVAPGDSHSYYVNYGSSFTFEDYNIEKDGYKLVGWSRNSEAISADAYTSGDNYTVYENGSITFYAIWEQTAVEPTPDEELYVRDGNTVYFGKYPQTLVDDSYVIETLNSMAGTLPDSYSSYSWTSYGYYANGNSQDYMWYIDLEFDGETYRGVYFTSYRPSYTENSSSQDGSYQDDNGYYTGTVYWFKYEPVSWSILSEENGVALILCNMIIDSQEFSAYDSSVYAHSNIRGWLNDTFYNTVFSDLQKDLILTITQSTAYVEDSNDFCDDKIYLLSYNEVSSLFDRDSARRKNLTDYAKAQGATASSSYGAWWLRTAVSKSYVHLVNCCGEIGTLINSDTYTTIYGVVPALYIRLEKGTEPIEPDQPEIPDTDGELFVRDGNTVYFGKYPQTLIDDPFITDNLDYLAGLLPNSYSNNSWTSYGYYANGSSLNYMWYIDLEYNGEMYRGVFFESYRPHFITDGASIGNSNQDDNGYYVSTVYWFKFEPIAWDIIEEADGVAALLCHVIIDSQDYDREGDLYYSSATIRDWLLDEFMNTAFTEAQRNILLLEGDYDYITLISADEAEYISSEFIYKDATDYAYSQGLYLDNKWWLRQDDGNKVIASGTDGSISYSGYGSTDYTAWGVVPMVFIDLSANGEGTDNPDDTDDPYQPGTDDNDTYVQEGETIYFGKYPQTLVNDYNLTYELDTLAGSLPSSYDNYNWTSYGYYANGSSQNYMWYIDLEFKGEMYRGVYFSSYRPQYTSDSFSSNSHQNENGYYTYTTYWFKYEPISWRIVDELDGKALIVSDLIIDAQEFQSESYLVGGYNLNNYEQSTVRAWLNDTFYNTAFNELQKSYINTTHVDNSSSQSAGKKYSCNDTEDKIFFLSNAELCKYSGKMNMQKSSSDYAKAQGSFTGGSGGAGCWGTRSPFDQADRIQEVFYDGSFGSTTSATTNWTVLGTVPALWISLH
ncbi:MAG: InlB B-repeat-containing protein [Clostridia bacterium]|nr:InlB B-repeat-containing protein [Clostridia bacterium]